MRSLILTEECDGGWVGGRMGRGVRGGEGGETVLGMQNEKKKL